MPIDLTTVQPLLQRSLNLMETTSCWARKAAKKAHKYGLQGEKRRLRWLYRNAQNVVDWTEHEIFDVIKVQGPDGQMTGLDISAQPGSADVSPMMCTMSTMNEIIDKLWIVYLEARQIENDLIIAKFKPFSVPLCKYADKLFCILAELQRAETEYEKAKYEYHHVSRYQVGWYNIHDDYEEKEEEQGYKDGIA